MISCDGFSVSSVHSTHQADFHKPVHKDAAHAGLHVILHAVDVADQRPPSPLQGSGQQRSGRAALGHDTAMHNLPWSHRDTVVVMQSANSARAPREVLKTGSLCMSATGYICCDPPGHEEAGQRSSPLRLQCRQETLQPPPLMEENGVCKMKMHGCIDIPLPGTGGP